MSAHAALTTAIPDSENRDPSNAIDERPPPREIQVTLVGHAAQEALDGAGLTGRTVGDFVIQSSLAATQLARWEALGFQICARDGYGREFELTPAILGLQPPRSLCREAAVRRSSD